MKYAAILIFGFLFSSTAIGEDECATWFNKSKVKPGQSGCDISCATIPVDFATLSCANRCDEFCGEVCSRAKTYVQKLVKSGKPPGWPHAEKAKQISDDELKILTNEVSKVPPELWPKDLKGIYRMEKSKDFPNPASHGGDMIVLYDTAFKRKDFARVLTHEFAHQIYSTLNHEEKNDYKMVTNWFEGKVGNKEYRIRREEGFVKEDGKSSPEEDFANNMEFFVFERSRLKSMTPHAEKWFIKKYGDKINRGSGCAK